MTAAGRRAELIRILRIRRRDKIQNLANELGVSERTIRRDLLTLTVDEGYMIDTKQGNGGGVVYNGRLKPHKGIFSQEQIKVLRELRGKANRRQAGIIDEMLDNFS